MSTLNNAERGARFILKLFRALNVRGNASLPADEVAHEFEISSGQVKNAFPAAIAYAEKKGWLIVQPHSFRLTEAGIAAA
jgi:hypothetical protein